MDFKASRVAEAAGGRLVAGDPATPGPRRAVVDSRAIEPGDLFVGLRGEHVDGGEFAEQALQAGAWGALISEAAALIRKPTAESRQPVIAAPDPLRALQFLAREWRRELGCPAIGV